MAPGLQQMHPSSWEPQEEEPVFFPPPAYIISDERRLLLPVSVVLDVPPLDLQGVGGRARPAEGTRHLYVLAAPCRDVVRHLCEERCARNRKGGVSPDKL